MFEDIIEITGKESGSTSIILAGVHGDEIGGITALKKIIANLKIEKGRVLLCFGNPRAIEKNVRYTEANLNRMFKPNNLLSAKDKQSYEYNRAQFLKKYLDQADALLDVHASFTPNSRIFVICEANAQKIVQYLPVDLLVSGFDQVEPGGTDYYMNSIGKIGICVECGYLGDPSSASIAEESIFAFLQAQGHLPNNRAPKKQSSIRMYNLYITTTNTFTLAKSFADFEVVRAGQLIGIDGTKEIRAKKDSIILFACNCTDVGEEAFLLGEKKDSLV